MQNIKIALEAERLFINTYICSDKYKYMNMVHKPIICNSLPPYIELRLFTRNAGKRNYMRMEKELKADGYDVLRMGCTLFIKWTDLLNYRIVYLLQNGTRKGVKI